MRRSGCLLVVAALLAAGAPVAPAGGTGGEGATSARGPVYPSWLSWWHDIRLTDNGADDRNPCTAVDPAGHCAIVWDRWGSLMWLNVDRNGSRLGSEKERLPGGFPVRESGFVAPCVAADAEGSFHLVSELDGTGAYYSKLDEYGTTLLPPAAVSAGASGPDNPSIAVAPDGNVSVVFEDNRWCATAQAIACSVLSNDGTVLQDAVRASDANWSCGGATVAVDGSGNIHIALLTTEQAAYHVMLDRKGDPVPQAPPTYLYKSGSVQTDGPPAIACDGRGAVHLVWNDRPSGTGNLRYMKLDGLGNKLAAGPDGFGIALTFGASCRGFPSIAADGTGNAFVFWSDVRNGNPQTWCLELMDGFVDVNETDLPGRANYVTRSTAGSALEPKAACDRVGNVYLAWRDNRDGNYEIYFKFGARYGMNLTMNGSDRENLLGVHPRQFRSGNISLENLGGWDDVANLSLNVDFHGRPGGTGAGYAGGGWKVWLSEPNVSLAYLDKKDVALNLRAPSSGAAGDYICVTVNCSFKYFGYINGRVAFRTYLDMNHSLDAKISDKVRFVESGGTAVFTLELENGGAYEEEVELSAECNPGWNWSLSDTGVRIDSNGRRSVGLYLTTPPDAAGDEIGTVTVTARLAEEPARFCTVDAQAGVSPVTGFSIWPDRPEGEVRPGGSADHVIAVSMSGNIREPVPVLLQASADRSGWSATLDADAVFLASGESERVVLRVLAPDGAAAGERCTVNVSCRNTEATISAECCVTVTALQVRAFRAAVSPAEASVLPGGKALLRVDVTNEGNGPDRFRLGNVTAPAGWEWSLSGQYGGGLDDAALVLESGGSGPFEVLVGAPRNATTGVNQFTARVADGAGNAQEVAFSVDVGQVFGLELSAPEAVLSGEPGGRVLFELTLRNTGNGPDMFALSATDLPGGWGRAEFRDGRNVIADALSLGASESGRMAVAVAVPERTEADDVMFNVTAASPGGPDATVVLELHVRKADLRITAVEVLAREPKVGRPVEVRLRVENRGEADAASVSLAYFRSGVPRTVAELGRIPQGGCATAVFVWVPVEGQNRLRFVADPADAVCERNETDNLAVYEKWVFGEKAMVLGNDGAHLAAAVIAGALAAGILWRRGARRNAKRGNSGQ